MADPIKNIQELTYSAMGKIVAGDLDASGAGGGGLTDTQLRASAVAVSNASLPLPTGASTSANQTTQSTKLDTLHTDLAALLTGPLVVGSHAVTGPLTDTQLRATPVPVSGTVTSNAGTGTLAVSAAALPLPSGASTATNQTSTQTPVTPATATATVGTLVGAQYNSTLPTFTNGQQGSLQVGPNGGLMVSGINGTAAKAIAVDASGQLQTVGAETAGAAVTGLGMRMMGSDATNARDILTDTSGRQIVVGAAAAASAIAGNPVLMAGTQSGTVRAINVDASGNIVLSGSGGTQTVGPQSASNANLWNAAGGAVVTGGGGFASVLVGVYDDVSTVAVTENNGSTVRIAADRALLVHEGGNSYNHISTATTTTVKSGAGTLCSITINTKGTVASATTVYDNTAGSGTVIGVIDSLNQSGTYTYNLLFTTGLTLVTTGTVAPDITVIYR